MNLIDWDNLGVALKRQQLTTKVRLVKFIHDWLNTGHQKQTFNEDAVDDCPVCNATKGTWTHMFQCEYKDSIARRTHTVTMFRSILLKLETEPINKHIMCHKILQWCGMTTGPAPRIADGKIGVILCSAVDNLQTISWDNFMKGHLSIK
eukprot:3606936-Ditylum_brightwellii.AAC.1